MDEEGGLIFVACGGPSSAYYILQATAFDALTGAATAWASLGALTLAPPPGTVNSRGLAWQASTRTLYTIVPYADMGNATAPQGAAVLVLGIALPAGRGPAGAASAPASSGLSTAGVVGIALACALAGALLAGLATRSLCKPKAEEEHPAYSSLN